MVAACWLPGTRGGGGRAGEKVRAVPPARPPACSRSCRLKLQPGLLLLLLAARATSGGKTQPSGPAISARRLQPHCRALQRGAGAAGRGPAYAAASAAAMSSTDTAPSSARAAASAAATCGVQMRAERVSGIQMQVEWG